MARRRLRDLIPPTLKRCYRHIMRRAGMLTNGLARYVGKSADLRKTLTGGEWEYYDVGRYVVKSIDLRKTLIGGDGGFDAGSWAELTGDIRRASILLGDSPHVKLLEQYRALGEELFDRRNLEQTPYFQNAARCVRYCGDYFGYRTREGLVAQARSFVDLYQRMANGDPTEVRFPPGGKHSDPGSLPAVRETLTANTFQIVGGNHRLASAWVCGRREIEAAVLQPPAPTALQSLILAGAPAAQPRELHQPIDSVEFDGTWGLVRRCDDRLAMMLGHLASTGHDISGLSVVDLACSYGWFVSEFSKRGAPAIGVDRAPWALKIGRIAYGLRQEQLVHGDLMTFLSGCDRTYDVVLLLSVLHHFALTPDFGSPEEVLKKVDAITGSCLFLETGQAHEQRWRDALPEWNTEFIIEFVRRHTSFSKVLPLGVDSDNRGPYSDNYARTLFACVRS